MSDRPLTVAAIETRGVVVPMARPLATGAGAVTTVPLMLVDLRTGEGVTGRSYIFAFYAALLGALTELTRASARAFRARRLCRSRSKPGCGRRSACPACRAWR